MRARKLLCALGFLALSLPLACGRSASSTGSNTNWLRHCETDSDCPGQNECWCHACTAVCASDAECDHGSCRAPSALGCALPSTSGANVCAAVCTSDADCAPEHSGFACVNGACLRGEEAISEGGSSGVGHGTGGSSAGAAATSGNGGGGGSGAAGEGGAEVPVGKRLAVAPQRTCVVADERLYCWGSNWFGETGVPNAEYVTEPTLVPGVSGVVGVALGGGHSCALTQDGGVYCFGTNASGELGIPSDPSHTCWNHVLDTDGQVPCETAPVRVPNLDTAVEIALGTAQSCARLADGGVRCWGDVAALANWAASVQHATSLALGALGACAGFADGKLSCSFDFPYQDELLPVSDVWLSDDSSGPGGAGFQCVLDLNANSRCFGADDVGQSGTGKVLTENIFPSGRSNVRTLALGSAHVCALGTDAGVACWGRNTYGAVGAQPFTSPICGSDTCEREPREVVGLPPIDVVDAAADRTCALATDRTLWCWGGLTPDFGEPVRVVGPWEGAGDMCLAAAADAVNARSQAYADANHECTTDADCVEVALDLSCDHTCATAALSQSGSLSYASALAGIETDACARSAAAGCAAPAPSCPEQNARPACNGGYCTLVDPSHSGCDDTCACFAQRAAASTTSVNGCNGFDLWVSVGWSCAACDHSALYVVVNNSGNAQFAGDAVLSFENFPLDTSGVQVADPVTVSLDLQPGTVSAPIRIESKAAGEVMIRVTADGDCQPLNDAGTDVLFPSPTNDCSG